MDSAGNCSLTTLLVFQNTIKEELIRSVHVYRLRDGRESEVEREFVFSRSGSYGEMRATPILTLQKFRVSEVSEGYQNGVWLCVFAFHADHKPQCSRVPRLLSVTRNPKLQLIPTLLNDLHMIHELNCKSKENDMLQTSSDERCQGNRNDSRQPRKILLQDLNCLPYPDDMPEPQDKEADEESLGMSDLPGNESDDESLDPAEWPDNDIIDESLPGNIEKKKRAASKDVASIGLADLVKYFDVPIVEASRNLKVGLTVLKRKCREFGIPRWPHRKIKSLDNLIHDLQKYLNREIISVRR
ncbi:protein RKD5 isoform X2 [Neltuma alba]|uniref:protein RKD5 isoform X2 n=1 Tax=Neltuma alba TaxID=207710 RepID=UPI0010A3D479|nr:protein RKD5 isoform X2 [Prosopis alba]